MDSRHALPPHFSSGGGYGGTQPLHPPPTDAAGRSAHDGEDIIDQRPPQHYEPHLHLSQHERRDINLTQQIAEKLLTAPAPRGGRGRDDARDVHEMDFLGPDEPPPIPPWEAYAHTDRQDAHKRRIGDDSLSPLRLHQTGATHPSLNIVNSAAFDEDENDVDDADAIDNAPLAATDTPKSVTFGTHDQIHQWDEALDVLKYVDDEFFNVARYLFNVVGTNGVITEEEYMLNKASFEEEYEKENGGGGLLSLLFGCTAGTAADFGTLRDERDEGNEEYRLTKKLVLDFYEAAKFRMDIISERDEDDEDDVAERTRDVVRKINAYGLPLLGSSAKIGIGCAEDRAASPSLGGEKLEARVDRGLAVEEDGEFLDTFGGGTRQRFFPVLPTDEENENDRTLSNLLRRKSRGAKGASPKAASSFKLPTATSLLSLLKIKPKSTSPSEEECHKRLAQIRHEMVKIHRMICSTRNEAVQAECRERMDRLNDEQRFYQIVQERYKLQSMMEVTEVAIVRSACKERLHQLIGELETLHFDYDNGEGAAVEDGKWYDRVLQYVGGGEPYPEYPQHASQYSRGRDPVRQQQNAGHYYGPRSPDQALTYGGSRSVPSPRTGATQNHSRYPGRGRRPFASPPVATAAKSRQSWFG